MTTFNRKIALLILVVPFLIYPSIGYAGDAPTFDEKGILKASIAENQPVGTEVRRFPVTDPDGDTLTFHLLGGGADLSENDGHGAFSIETDGNEGVLKTKVILDYETQDFYALGIMVTDGTYWATTYVGIAVTNDESDDDTNVPNGAPVFDDGESTTRSIAENAPVGTNIGSPIAATDPNNDPLSYGIWYNGTYGLIALDRDTGQLKTDALLDYETQSSYLVRISADDGKGGQDSIDVTIEIIDVDEPNPNLGRSEGAPKKDNNTDQQESDIVQRSIEEQPKSPVKQTTPPDTETPIDPPRTLNKFDAPVQIGFSELMFTSRGGLRSLPQWLELYNNSDTDAVNLKGWQLEIEARDDGGAHRHAVITLETLHIPANQTALIVTWPGRSSSVDLPADRIYNFFDHHSGDFEQNAHRNKVLGFAGFSLKLSDPEGIISDIAGNLDGDSLTEDKPAWELPDATTEDGARTSLMRRYERGTGVPLNGTVASNWVPASELTLQVTTYWGRATDIGNPGYRGEGAVPVQLSSFRAARLETSTVVIEWTTESELDNAGFNILRSQTRQGPFLKVNPTLIIGAGTTSERHEYTWRDTTAQPNIAYYYQIEDVSFAGEHQRLSTVRMKGHLSANGKLLQKWVDLKQLE